MGNKQLSEEPYSGTSEDTNTLAGYTSADNAGGGDAYEADAGELAVVGDPH